MKRYLGLTIILALSFGLAKSQTQVLNNNRTSLKWQRIITDDFKIIFPKGFEAEAQRVANTLQLVHDPIDQTLETHTRKATILLQNQTSVSNGFVALGPRRSEFFTSTPHDYNFLGTNDWLNTLAIHEYRHLAQYNKSRTGFNKLFYYMFGQNTQAAMAGIAAPAWFWEGDATVTETAFTQSGRGRIPAFNRVFRANLLEGKRYNYNKQSLRSYRDFVPNHYVLGYHMVSHIRKKTNNANVFSDVTKKTWDVPFIPFAFSSALKKSTGKYVRANYEDMMDELAAEWKEQLSRVELTSFEKISERSDDSFTDYENPSQMANGKVFAHKSGIGEIDQFVMLNQDGSEEKLFTPGIINNSGMLSVVGNTVVWNEFAFDSRWRNQSYSVIKTYNADTETLRTLTKKSRYHGSSLSPDTRQVATIESLEYGTYRLVVLDANTGELVHVYDNATQGLLTLPSWSSDGKQIVFLSNKSSKKSVQVVDVISGKESSLIPLGTENIGNPSIVGNHLFYQSDYSGIDNIYVLDLENNRRYQVTSSKYGAYNISLSNDRKTIFYNDYSVNGLDVVSTTFEPAAWKVLEDVPANKIGYFQTLEEQEHQSHILDNAPDKKYDVRKHSPLRGLINPHSWGPFVNTDDLNQVEIGVFSKDVLSTTSIYAGYDYNIDTQEGAMVGRVSYQGFYPILDFEFKKGQRSDGASTWDEQTIEYGVRVPLLLTKSKYNTGITFGNSLAHTIVSDYSNGFDDLGRRFDFEGTTEDGVDVRVRGTRFSDLENGLLTYNHFTINYYHLLKQSTRDINSKFGQSFVFEHFQSLSGDYNGSLTAIRGALYFPGIFKHHSFFIRGALQSRKIVNEPNLYAFPGRVYRPRGYDSYPSDKNSSLVQINYSLPLWCPDFSFGPLLNIKRIKVNLFTDIGKSTEIRYLTVTRVDDPSVGGLQDTPILANYLSFGAELTFDINVMRALPELELGVRYSYASSNTYFPQANKIELIIGNISF